MKVRKGLAMPADSVVQFAGLLIEQAQDDVAWIEYDNYEPGESSWDPLTMSFNWQWPERLRGLFQLAMRDEDASWKPARFPSHRGGARPNGSPRCWSCGARRAPRPNVQPRA